MSRQDLSTRGKTRTAISMQEHQQLQCRSMWFWQQNVSRWASHTNICVSRCFHCVHAEMKDEVCVKMDADTPRLIREENLPNLKPFVSTTWTEALYGYRGSPRCWKDAGCRVRGSERSWTRTEQDRQFFVHGPGKFHSVRARGRRTSLWGRSACAFYGTKAETKVPDERKRAVWPRLETQLRSWVAKWSEQAGCTDSSRQSRFIDHSLKDMHMEKCNLASATGLQASDKDLATERAAP